MKTPMQKLIDTIYRRCNDSQMVTMDYAYLDAAKLAESMLQEEKKWIVSCYHSGWDDGANNNYRPVNKLICEVGEDLYNKKFKE
jgi:hypothetical protein